MHIFFLDIFQIFNLLYFFPRSLVKKYLNFINISFKIFVRRLKNFHLYCIQRYHQIHYRSHEN